MSKQIIVDSSRGNGDFDEGFPPLEKVGFVAIADDVPETTIKKRPERLAHNHKVERSAPKQQAPVVPVKPAIKQIHSTAEPEKKPTKKKKPKAPKTEKKPKSKSGGYQNMFAALDSD